jgi:ABC-type lipoprotein release transport system permease subunit
VGIAVGVAGALALSRVLETLLYGVGTLDPVTFLVVPVLLGMVAVVASWTPAQRAASVDPVAALRQG